VVGRDVVKIYELTPIGYSESMNPNRNDTVGLKVVNFMRRHQNRATDEQLIEWLGVTRDDLRTLEGKKIRVIG